MAEKKTSSIKVGDSQLDEITEALENALAVHYRATQGVKRDGNEIVVPSFMSLDDAAAAIASYSEEMEEEQQTRLDLDAHPWDAMYAFHQSIEAVYGALLSRATYSFFGKIPGKKMTIPIDGRGGTITVPVGATKVPGLPISLNIVVTDPKEWQPGQVGAVIVFTNKAKYSPIVKDIENRCLEHLRQQSIFRGKAMDSGYNFLNLGGFRPESVVYSAQQFLALNANVFTVVKARERALAANIPIKRGILLHGQYGTGKTLTALYTANLCESHGWTFILVRGEDNVSSAIKMAQKLEPAVVFCEDIDAAAGEERTDKVNNILNTIDGMLGKDSQVMVILTTNHIERVNPAMLRPGRLDAVIELGVLDDEGILRFIRESALDSQGHMMLHDKLDEKAICKAARGYVPAFLKEAVSKAVLYAIARGDYNGASAHISSDDIVGALNELRPQYELMMKPRGRQQSASFDEHLAEYIGRAVVSSKDPGFQPIAETLEVKAERH